MVINCGQHILRFIRDFGLNEKFFPRKSFDRIANPVEGGVAFGSVEVSDPLVVSVMNQLDKILFVLFVILTQFLFYKLYQYNIVSFF